MAKIQGDITDLLHSDHQKVRELFFQFSETEAETEKQKIITQIITELYIHSTAEEEIVYPSLAKKQRKAKDLVNEALVEHKSVKYLLAELSQMKASDDLFDAKVTVLCELVNHHVKEEEKEMFKDLRESKLDLKALAKQVMERKNQLKAQPLPEMEASLTVGEQEEIAKPIQGHFKSARKKTA